MMNSGIRRTLSVLIILLAVICFSGCGGSKEEEALTPADFTVVPPEELPEALKTIIEDKKTGDMSLTYATDSELYIVKGYGTRPNDGYNVRVKTCAVGNESIIFKTELTGPKKDDKTTGIPSYPYIVVKLKAMNLPVSFS